MEGGDGPRYDPLPSGEERTAPEHNEEEGSLVAEIGEGGPTDPADSQNGGEQGTFDPDTEGVEDPEAVLLANLGVRVMKIAMFLLAFSVYTLIYPLLGAILDSEKSEGSEGSLLDKALLGWFGFYFLVACTGAHGGAINQRSAFYFRGYLFILSTIEGLARFLLFIYFFIEFFGNAGPDVGGGITGYALFTFGYQTVIFVILMICGICYSSELLSAIASARPDQIERAKAIRKRRGRR